MIGTSIDHVEKAKDAWKFGHVAEEPWLEATIPTLARPVARARGQARDERVGRGRAAAPARRRLVDRARPPGRRRP